MVGLVRTHVSLISHAAAAGLEPGVLLTLTTKWI